MYIRWHNWLTEPLSLLMLWEKETKKTQNKTKMKVQKKKKRKKKLISQFASGRSSENHAELFIKPIMIIVIIIIITITTTIVIRMNIN